MTANGVVLKAKRGRNLSPGLAAVAIGLLALAIAAVEGLVFNDIADLGFGTMGYIASYAVAGVVLIAVGVWKIFRS